MSVRREKPRVAVVLTTVGTEEQALAIANHLVDERLAACVNVLPKMRSIYRWKRKVNDDVEHLLLVKTLEPDLERVREAIRKVHPYELPEVLGFTADFADEAFAKWVRDATRRRR